MLLGTELKTPFRWYDSLEKQNRFIPNCHGECLFQLFMPYNSLLPFQIRQPSVAGDQWTGTVLRWKVWTLSGMMAYDLEAYKGDIVRFSGGGAQYFSYMGNIPMISMEQGYYYATIELTTGGIFYSEVFFVDRTPNKQYLKIRWYNNCDVGNIVYSFSNYKSELWLETPISRNEPSLVEDGIENGAKQFLPTTQYFTDNFTLDEFVPEYILTALTIVNMHDVIEISEPNTADLFVPVRNFKTNFTWEGTDCMAVVTCRFQRESVIIKNRCCENVQIIKMAPYIVSELTNISSHHGFIVGQGLGYEISWTPVTPAAITHVLIRGDFNRTGDEIVQVNQPANSVFIPAGFGFDITLEVTPVNIVNGRITITGDTYYVVSTS